jgi:serine-type D-Ala-D-Ala carboxypeptidase
MPSRSISAITTALLLQVFIAASVPGQSCPVGSATLLSRNGLAPIGDIVHHEIEAGRIPGAVIEIGQRGEIIYRQAFGDRETKPERLAMMPDTIFDLASLTKVVATSVAIMQLKERHRIDLDAPVTRYWPRFGRNGKGAITVRELLTHYSGLPADLNLEPRWLGYRRALRMIETEKPLDPPGAHYRYSDINFEVLGELVHRVSGLPLDIYCERYIFHPLGMVDTFFRPSAGERARIAPTAYAGGRLYLGRVNDPTSERMGGVAGHAGLFSTADDLALFAEMMLNRGSWHQIHVLSERSVDEMTNAESPRSARRLRGLGWDLAAPFCSDRNGVAKTGSYGHTGFTGTMIWIDPASESFVIILTNRTYPGATGDAGPLRQRVVDLISNSLGLGSKPGP